MSTGAKRHTTMQQLSGVAQVGRICVTLPANANLLPITRDVPIGIEGRPPLSGSGLAQGQHMVPVAE